MPANASPTKQRAALAPMDANAMPHLSSPKVLKDTKAPAVSSIRASPLKRLVPATVSGTKRPVEDARLPASKKTCMEEDARSHRSRTTSPSTSSVFDTTAVEGDASWATTTTEPEMAGTVAAGAPLAPLAPRTRGNMTREQAREKAEILRLRLGLASYKLRTGQTNVPLADLQHKPLPPLSSIRVQSAALDEKVGRGNNQTTSSLNSSASILSRSTPGTRPVSPKQPVQQIALNERPRQ
ncbi:hypothetical protein E4U22_004875 [Claviceps purpurea]|nr:hypothetical protein E4U12_003804 [Claviceps purpurea]KAG6178590.1 hypothetical protein E4U27_003651 [Claviceps purpurea]KAG6238208.1 hypothetical protein E4U25_001939 [Claviceps purpurea]KAG6251240.1 hypothetical protein E4U23_000828 [Claviceps purpurea]KAG6257630.1 hypothetical protein E4U24_004193 [Claviceps purpurea]